MHVSKVEMIEIAERVEEAFDTVKRLPDRDRSRLGMQVMDWPLVIRKMFEDAPSGEATRLKRPPPAPGAIDRMHQVFGWMVALAKMDRDFARAVYLCLGRRMNPAEAAKVMGVHRQTMRRWRDNGLERIAVLRRQKLAA